MADVFRAIARAFFIDPIYFGKYFFSGPNRLFYLPFAEFHHKIIRSLIRTKKRLSVIVVARGFGKTNLVTVLYAIWSVFLRKRKYVILISYSQGKSIKNLRRIQNLIKQKNFRKVFRYKILIENFTNGIIQIQRRNGSIHTFEAKGVNQPIFGAGEMEARPDLIIMDDLEDLKIASNPERVEAMLKWFSVEVRFAMQRRDAMGRKGQIILIGTPLDMNSFLAKVMAWKINIQLYPGLVDADGNADADGQSIWPEMHPTAELKEERDDFFKEGRSAEWRSQILLDPGGLRVLKFEESKMVKIPYDEVQANLKGGKYEVYIMDDMAYTRKTYSAYSGITVSGHLGNSQIDFLQSRRGKWTPEEHFNELWELKQIYKRHLEGVYVETTQFANTASFMREYAWRTKREQFDIFPLERPGKYYTQDKDSRIGMLVGYYNFGLMRVYEEDNYPLCRDMWNWDGKNGDKLDVLDSASFNAFFLDESVREVSRERELGDPKYSAEADIYLTLKNIERRNEALNSEDYDYFDNIDVEGNVAQEVGDENDYYDDGNFLDSI